MYIWRIGPQNSYSLMIFEYLSHDFFFFLPTGPNLESNYFGGQSKGAYPNVSKNKRKEMTKEMPRTNSSKEIKTWLPFLGIE